MQELDPRIVKVSIEVNGRLKTYDGLSFEIDGCKYANAIQNECEIKIGNLDKDTLSYILTETSPFNKNKTPKRVIVEVGRISYGTAQLFIGNIVSSKLSQPPDVTVQLKCLTNNFSKGNIISTNQSSQAKLSQIANGVASTLGVKCNFQATDKQVNNYSYSGPSLKQIDSLNQMGNVNAYIDDDVLIVKNNNTPLANRIQIINANTGMIGIAGATEQGIKVKFLINSLTVLGGLLRIESSQYPEQNGDYEVYKLHFEVASRDIPFYYIAEAKRI